MRQRILKKIGEAKARHEAQQGPPVTANAEDSVEGTVITDQVMAGGGTAITATVMAGIPHPPTNVNTREMLKKVLLAKAAIASEKNPMEKVQREEGIKSKNDGHKGGGLAKGPGLGTLASSSTAERDAIMRLLAS